MFVYIIFRFFVFLFRIMPFWFIYGLSDFICFMLHRVLHYRYKVVVDNLTKTFPDMPPAEKKKVISRFYRNLSDLLVESVKGFSITEKQIKKRFILLNAEILEPYRLRNKSAIAVTSHNGNWEWGILAAPLYTKMISVGLYKPLKNKRLDDYMKRNRGRNGAHLTSIYLTAISFERYMNESSLVMMIADQSPSNIRKAFWVNFLGIDTACLHGPEKYAKIYDLPVLYFNVHRFKRGHYEVEFFNITDTPKTEPDGHITEVYMKKLEEYIRRYPSNWLWSHRRWKHKRSDAVTKK
jgi:Kdo2-lipid IVA lauroyltransferase/acyltransferase